ncbi:hypothetical protein BGZ54_003754, partial [Gamsiella multidivaricata]
MKLSFSALFTAAATAGLFTLSSMVKAAAIPAAGHSPVAVATLPTHSFEKRSIAGINNFNCKLTPKHPRPLLLVHATLLTMDSWWTFAPHLIKEGYCVFALTYGRYDNIPFVGGIAPVADAAQEVATFGEQVLQKMNATELDYVGHSQGGILGRYWAKYLGGANKIN